jgi:hypothetical protein
MRYRVFFVLLGCGAVGALVPSSAVGGSYTVNACLDDSRGANFSWTSASSNADLPSYNAGCSGSSAEGLIARAAAKAVGVLVPAFASAGWTFDAPASTTIDRADLSARLYRYGGGSSDRWGVGIGDETGAYLLGGVGQSALSSGGRGSYFALSISNRTSLRLGVVCANGDGCSVQATNVAAARYSRASTELFGARVRISDPTTAALYGESGALWTSSGWLSGRQGLAFTASDNVGIASLAGSVGTERRVITSACDYARPIPCPTSRELSTSFDTSALKDGAHSVTIAATDSGGNESSETRQVLIDNTAPGPAGTPQLAGSPSSNWRVINDFTLSYTNPAKAGGAPLSSHDIELCEVNADEAIDPGRCNIEARPGAPAIDSVSLPAVGRYKFRVRVNDELFKGQWSAWSPLLQFDDTLPGTPTVVFPSGWVNRQQSAAPLVLAAPGSSPPPPSGYASYRVTVDGGALVTVPAEGSGEIGLFNLANLSDGRHRLSVSAVSGAGLATPTLLAASGDLSKDVVAPALAVTGAPAHGAFVTTTVELRMNASDATSGMDGAVSPAPITAGGYVSTQLDHAANSLTAGPIADLIPGDGEHVVQIYAADVAGNRSAVESFAYTQDTVSPSGGLRPIRADHPDLLDFFIDERCLGRASIEISVTPGVWRPLATSEAFQRASAFVPGDISGPRTPFTVRALVSDCAGLASSLTNWYGGERSGTPIGTIVSPAREVISAKATIVPLASRSSTSASAHRRVTALVVDSSGDPLPNLSVRIETEPWMTPASWEPAGSARTDSKGRAVATVEAHSSLRIRAVVPGNEFRNEAISNNAYVTRLASTTISSRPRKVRRGAVTTIAGRLRGGLNPRSGFQLVLSGKGPRSRGWVPIRTTVAVSANGYWSTRYRFLRSSRGKFYFRVRPPNRPDYPYRSAESQSVRVVVR